MKVLILAFLFLAVASASFPDVRGTALKLLMEEAEKKIHVKWNSTAFWEGVNGQFGLVSNEVAETCVAYVKPTLEGLRFEEWAISSLHWFAAFNYSYNVAYSLEYFTEYCETPYFAYADHFGEAIEAAHKDLKGFLKQLWKNLGEGDSATITNLTNLIASILENNDKSVGESFANLINIGLSTYLPSKTTKQIIY